METIPLWALIPFVVMLLCIAIGPLVAEHWWENNKNKLIVSLILGIPTAIWLCLNGLSDKLIHQMVFDYVPFIILLTALFTVTGGIRISGNLAAKPIVNTAFLGIGYLLASIMGTTGAAMLLIRPLIETNQERKHKVHTILFFIAAAAAIKNKMVCTLCLRSWLVSISGRISNIAAPVVPMIEANK